MSGGKGRILCGTLIGGSQRKIGSTVELSQPEGAAFSFNSRREDLAQIRLSDDLCEQRIAWLFQGREGEGIAELQGRVVFTAEEEVEP